MHREVSPRKASLTALFTCLALLMATTMVQGTLTTSEVIPKHQPLFICGDLAV